MISAVITNLNNKNELWFTLQSVISELDSTGRDYEVVVADNGSNEEELGAVQKMVATFAKFKPVRLTVWDRRKSCPGIRTAGVLESKGDLITFLDGHVILKHNYFQDTLPLFDDQSVMVVFAPEVYNAELLYEYPAWQQLKWETSSTTWVPMATEPYPVLAACQACTTIRRDILNFFYPFDELDYIPYSMDEPNLPILTWMFGGKVLMNTKTYYAHRPWAYTPNGNCDYESWRPLGAYAIGGQSEFEKSYNYWHSDKELVKPERHRLFIENNAKVKFKDLKEYLISQGVKI